MATPPVVPWVLAFTGVGLLVAAVQDRSPIGELRAALTGSPSPGRGSTPAGPATVTAAAGLVTTGAPTTAVTGDNDNNKRTPPPLYPLPDNPGHRVSSVMLPRFVQWVALFGEPIYVTDSYRTYEQQAASYAKDPDRFGKPDTSLHVEGNAVDVHLPRMRANYYGTAEEKARYVKLWNAAKQAGLCAARFKLDDQANNKMDEPWHFGTRCG